MRVERVADFIQDFYTTTLTTGDIILGFDIPAPKAPLRWGIAKVARKSGAFAQSIAIAVMQGKDGPVSATLAGAGPRPLPLPATSHQLTLIGSTEQQVRGAISHRPRHPFCRARRLSKTDAHREHLARRTGHAGPMTAITVELNGVKINDDVEPRQTLADFVRDRCGLTATHLGCEHGACGACTVVVDGVATRSCLTLAAMSDGRSVMTLEGLRSDPRDGRCCAGISTRATRCNAASARRAC